MCKKTLGPKISKFASLGICCDVVMIVGLMLGGYMYMWGCWFYSLPSPLSNEFGFMRYTEICVCVWGMCNKELC